MVKKRILVLSMVVAALLVYAMNANLDESPYWRNVSSAAASFGEFTGMGAGTFATGLLIEYAILLVAVYLFLRGIVKRFER
ncbi:MAG: hypothetical protein JSV39_04885 [Candidatus Aenigmatarchaeota archaeon]|nr:MAG: hypothetical protein JSV39_04885 [Candidatus Aenigmarchaeota archaeon]